MPPSVRTPKGQFVKGTSGNPGGRPTGGGVVRSLARDHTEEAIEVLVKLMRRADKESTQIAAANSILERGWGRPGPPTADDGGDVDPLTATDRVLEDIVARYMEKHGRQ